MKQSFQGWNKVVKHLEHLAATQGGANWSLNDGQCASLRGIGKRLPRNGIVIADEVGMGKTRIAVAVAQSVIKAGGRVAILVPPGLGFQWHDELRDGGVAAPPLLRSLWQFLAVWASNSPTESDWLEQDVILISHAFTNWKLGENSGAWRWALLPTLYGWWRKSTRNRFPNGFGDHEELDDDWVQAAARTIAATISHLNEDHPARRLMDELCTHIPSWSDTLDPARYGRNQPLRPWLESAVGLGLGTFDLVIIDEAHKSRGDQSGLSRMLDRVVIPSDRVRRLAMTATPVELDASQWHQALERIGASGVGHSKADGDIFQRYADACARVRQCPNDAEGRATYRALAQMFEQALTPYLLRRDKLELDCVKDFARHTESAPHAYRHEQEIPVDTLGLDATWRQAVCAAEALSIVTRQAEDSLSKRLRLTLGNGHGIAALLDQVKQDPDKDQQQIKQDQGPGEISTDHDRSIRQDKRQHRADWWRQVMTNAFSSANNPLFDHPAILAAVDAIEEATHSGEKVLVFGRFTLPLQALVAILNARALLRTLDSGASWNQAKVHEDEWPAIQAAHRQLERPNPLDRDELDRRLTGQYQRLENRRRRSRDHLIKLLDAGVKDGRSRAVLEAFKGAVAQHGSGGDSPLAVVAKALSELTGLGADEPSAAQHLSAAFEELIEAVCEHSDGDESGDDDMSPEDAAELWAELRDRLANEYNRPEGGFARLMYGGTAPDTRRLLQLAFNRAGSNPRVLVAQSVVGREGLNLHKACRTVVLLHPEWNPGVVEQQIGRVDRVASRWEHVLKEALDNGLPGEQLPRILVRPVIFRGTYDERNWDVLRERWDDLRAQLHGVVISPALAQTAGLSKTLVEEINACAPRFRP
ncbi:type III restriction endonuclease subunit R [Thiorhodococcus mannitoliphagus]|uniref:Type III restriction endonuclease subunit R n=1 Tax=Thiorhodococcus mannitoliphagus TaxID=329406 RepID=A0A6P1E0K3_9GAMM|nr:helicase-related protein [Thiorhodococcus mannitoliphagus]NEX22783.1 type III restriction endonuclease subunit R [Thiorhodococcus mannitoliphagus]